MKRRIPWSALLIVLALVLAACGGGGGKSRPTPTGYIVSGSVETFSGIGVPGVTLSLGDNTVTTDDEGRWTFTEVEGKQSITAAPPAGHLVCPFVIEVSVASTNLLFTSHDGDWGPGGMAGAGVADDPYVITDVEQLQAVDRELHDNFILCDHVNASGKNDFTPIASGNPGGFQGSFDGRGYEIRELHIQDSINSDIGLFATIGEGAEVRNVGLVGGSVKGVQYVGALAGGNRGTIENVYNTGSMTGEKAVGGLVGYNGGTIDNAYNTGSITGDDDVGGVVGYNGYEALIKTSYNSGNVTGTEYVGGVVGDNDEGVIEKSFNTGTVQSEGKAGGIVGNNTGGIKYSYNTGNVVGKEYAGGVAGDNDGLLHNSYNMADVSGQGKVGGVAGENEDTIKHTYSTGKVTGDRDVGGVVGNSYGTVTSSFFLAGSAHDNSVPGAEPKSETEMKQKSTYEDAGWDPGLWLLMDGDYPDLTGNRR